MSQEPRGPAPTLADARALDARDELAGLRRRFSLPAGVCYLDGNSLGALPDSVSATVGRAIEADWGTNLIRSWFDHGWWEAPLRVGDLISGILGCAEGQVVVGDSVSVQIFNLLSAAVRLRPDRTKILLDADVFPTDRYMAASVARLLGSELRQVAMAEMPAALDTSGCDTAVVLASVVDYRSGRLWDVAELTRLCHRQDTLVMWDLCHAAGAIPLRLDDDGVDLAVGCTYKYLSGGPGSPAFAYIAERYQSTVDLPLSGWHGHQRPFDFAAEYVPAEGIARARIGTPPILSMIALEEALSVFRDAPLDLLRAKNLALGTFFFACLDALPLNLGLGCITPRDERRRASQVTLTHPRSDELMQGLLQRGVICDQRPPSLLRFGLNGLYVRFEDVFRAVESLADVIAELAQ